MEEDTEEYREKKKTQSQYQAQNELLTCFDLPLYNSEL